MGSIVDARGSCAQPQHLPDVLQVFRASPAEVVEGQPFIQAEEL